ncbi:hypothetical protein HC891_23665 [Candidatus Gracilibacteria bacterium]|nr:hypothetical protein [Candidatus Gracilibacteria bacterium]
MKAGQYQLKEAPLPEQRGIVRSIFDRVWVTAHEVCAIMPHAVYLPLASAMLEVCVHGGPGGFQFTHLRTLPIVRLRYQQPQRVADGIARGNQAA